MKQKQFTETIQNHYQTNPLWSMGLQTIKELETEQGILASGREEIYGCIFGRDSLISALKLLKAYEQTNDPYLLLVVKKILQNLNALQGSQINIESGEEPGKCIHEYRPSNHEHLTRDLEKPWYVYPDNKMRNYDSVDSTPLFLTALHRYYTLSGDTDFLEEALPHVYSAIDWIILYGDTNYDGLLDYRLHPDRTHGGLVTQSWMDSGESVFHEDGASVTYPIAPLEVQAYAFTALKLWANYFSKDYSERAQLLDTKAKNLKTKFNEQFIIGSGKNISIAAGIDGAGRSMQAVRSSMGHVLWSSFFNGKKQESIIENKYIARLVKRLLTPDIFEPAAGIRTLSTESSQFTANSYHNGSIWPHDNALIAEGMDVFGFKKEAAAVRKAMLTAIQHFNTPIELFVYENNSHKDYEGPTGQKACKKQAWSAAGLLA